MGLAGAAVVAGVVAFVSGAGGAGAPGTYGTLISSWLFFAGGALGATTAGALFNIIPARWARSLVALGRAPAAFGPVALAVLMVLLAGAARAPWVSESRGWLATPALVIREVVLSAMLFGAAWIWFGPRARTPAGRGVAPAVAFLIGYTLVLSVWAFDFVLGPDPVFGSTLIGPFLFVSTFLAGFDLLVLLALGQLPDPDRRDTASFLLAVTVFWTYLFASQFLTIWYGNLPDETEFLLRRMEGGWAWTGLLMLALVFVTPFVALLQGAARSSSRVLAGVLSGQVLGLWLLCQILVVPSLTAGDSLLPFHPRALLIALGLAGAFILCFAAAPKHGPAPVPERETA
jgi:hypothetical protein